MKILISGAGFANKGSEAMLRTTQRELTKRLSSIEFFGWRIFDWNSRCAIEKGLTPLPLPFETNISVWSLLKGRVGVFPWALSEILRKHNPKDIPHVFSSQKLFNRACLLYLDRITNGIDASVNISGFAFCDSMGERGFNSIYPTIDFCEERGKPTFFLPQAWGSFEKPKVKKAIKRLLRGKQTMFFSRDDKSSRYLEKILGKPSHSIESFPDIAFRFEGGTRKQGEQILKSIGCSIKRKIIGVSPNMRVYERVSGSGTGNKYIQALAKLCSYCIEKYEVDIVLQSNQIQKMGTFLADDRYLCSLICDLVNRPDRCFFVNTFLSAEESKALIGCFEFLVSSRFHSLIFAFSMGIPSMAVSWSHKYQELFSLFKMEDDVNDCKNMNIHTLISTFDRCWGEKNKKVPLISSKVKILQKRIDNLFDEVATKIQLAHEKK